MSDWVSTVMDYETENGGAIPKPERDRWNEEHYSMGERDVLHWGQRLLLLDS